MIFNSHQIQISHFSRHFYVVNVILISVFHFWTNFDEKKKLFRFYVSFFNVMTISLRSEGEKNISDTLLDIESVHNNLV